MIYIFFVCCFFFCYKSDVIVILSHLIGLCGIKCFLFLNKAYYVSSFLSLLGGGCLIQIRISIHEKKQKTAREKNF